MPSLGPISGLSMAKQSNLLFDLDFENYDRDDSLASLVKIVRGSKAGAFDKNGVYREVDHNTPVFGFDVVSRRSGLILDPTSINGCMTTVSQPLGYTVGGSLLFDTPVPGPDGKDSARRVQGTKTGEGPSASYLLPNGEGVSLSIAVRYVPGGHQIFNCRLRNNTTNTTFPSVTLDLLTGVLDNANPSNQRASAYRFPNGWWLVTLSRKAGFNSGDVANFYALASGNITYGAVDLWYAQLESRNEPSGLIIPGTVRLARVAAGSGSKIEIMDKWDRAVGWSLISEVSKEMGNISGTTEWYGNYISQTTRNYTTFSPTTGMPNQYAQQTAAILAPVATGVVSPFTAKLGYSMLVGKKLKAAISGSVKESAEVATDPLPNFVDFSLSSSSMNNKLVMHRIVAVAGEIDLESATR